MLKIGIIGLGVIGQRLLSQFEEHRAVSITAVCDVSEVLAKQTAERLGDVQFYTDYQHLIADGNVELVYVAVPPKLHHAIVMHALQAKKHVLCEKPLANSLEEAEEMARAAKEAGIVHAMNFPLNYGQAATKFAELLSEGYIGKLRRVQLTMNFPQWPRAWQQNNWVGEREQGGFVLEVGVHYIQQILKLFGEMNNIHSKLEFPDNPISCETGILATAELVDGTPVLIEGLSQISGIEYIGFTAYGSEGVLSIENWGMLRGGKTGEELEVLSLEETVPSRLIDELVKAVNGEKAEIYDFEVGYQAQKILECLRA
ncbi:Gfo/Idh/MocA family protein [Sporosarcina sp. ITBMC105]